MTSIYDRAYAALDECAEVMVELTYPQQPGVPSAANAWETARMHFEAIRRIIATDAHYRHTEGGDLYTADGIRLQTTAGDPSGRATTRQPLPSSPSWTPQDADAPVDVPEPDPVVVVWWVRRLQYDVTNYGDARKQRIVWESHVPCADCGRTEYDADRSQGGERHPVRCSHCGTNNGYVREVLPDAAKIYRQAFHDAIPPKPWTMENRTAQQPVPPPGLWTVLPKPMNPDAPRCPSCHSNEWVFQHPTQGGHPWVCVKSHIPNGLPKYFYNSPEDLVVPPSPAPPSPASLPDPPASSDIDERIIAQHFQTHTRTITHAARFTAPRGEPSDSVSDMPLCPVCGKNRKVAEFPSGHPYRFICRAWREHPNKQAHLWNPEPRCPHCQTNREVKRIEGMDPYTHVCENHGNHMTLGPVYFDAGLVYPQPEPVMPTCPLCHTNEYVDLNAPGNSHATHRCKNRRAHADDYSYFSPMPVCPQCGTNTHVIEVKGRLGLDKNWYQCERKTDHPRPRVFHSEDGANVAPGASTPGSPRSEGDL